MSVISLTNSSFSTEVSGTDKPVLIDFYADWCGPCRMVSPLVEEIAEENPDIKVCKVNVDSEPELAEKFDVASIPTLVAMRNSEEIDRTIGAAAKQTILGMFGM